MHRRASIFMLSAPLGARALSCSLHRSSDHYKIFSCKWGGVAWGGGANNVLLHLHKEMMPH